MLAACQGLGLVWSECSLLHLLLWDAGHLAGPLLTMWASRSFPNTKSGILGGCACIWSVQTFLSSRVCSWESCDARQAAAHPPGRGRQAWGCRGSWTSPDYTGVISPLLVWIPTPGGTAGLQSHPVPLHCPREGSRGLLGAGAGSSRQFWQEAQLEAPPGR